MVLATNVAETSLTVPGIRYVIDPGTARISRYSQRTKVQRLPIEPISQASANQRKGRCGRTSDGICIRLYSEADFESRPEFTDPEILRTNLASVILQMAALDLGDMADFPFVEPPESRNIADGVRLLEELGAFSPGHAPGRGRTRLTETGRKLSRLPLDPRLGRMILEAGRNGCVREVLIITAALSIIDPRERPTDARQAADEMHARFAEPGSDFLAFLNLWDYLRERQSQLSTSAFRRLCRREYLHFLRVREWQDVYGQLRQAAADLGIQAGRERRGSQPVRQRSRAQQQRRSAAARASGGAGSGRGRAAPGWRPRGSGSRDAEAGTHFPAELADRVHMSLLSGLLSHIGMQDTDAKAARKAAAADRVRRRPRGPVRHLPGLVAGQEAAAVGGRGGTGGDVAAVGQGRGPHRTGMGRVPGRAPGPAQLQRAALGRPARRGGGYREGQPVRAADRGRPDGHVRPDRPRRRPGPVHHARPGRGRLADPPQVLRPQPADAGRRRGPGTQGQAARAHRRRQRPVRVL